MSSSKSKNNIVKLNVGGVSFNTTRNTISNSQRLIEMIEDDYSETFLNENDEIFIDRDGLLFRYVLQYMRTGEINVEVHLKDLKNEAKYYQLANLEDRIDEVLKKNSSTRLYRLVDRREFEGLTGNSLPVSFSKISLLSKKEKYELITSYSFTQHVYKCTRGIPVHDNPDKPTDKCGRKCYATPACAHTGWVGEQTEMYLIAYDYYKDD